MMEVIWTPVGGLMAHARTSGSPTRGTSSGVLVRVNIVSCQVNRCIAPAQGYTQSDHRPSVKLVRIPTASTAMIIIGEKTLQNGSFPGGRSAGGTFESGR
jgi:hypothetical protein